MEEFVTRIVREGYAGNVERTSTYKRFGVMADSSVDGHRRVLPAGEAAHLLAPFGARGMNPCVADADEAASAIAVALQANDAAARNEIGFCAARRERAAEYNIDAAGQALDYLQGDTPVTVLQKEVAASLADHFEPAGEYLDDAPYGPHEAPPIAATGNY